MVYIHIVRWCTVHTTSNILFTVKILERIIQIELIMKHFHKALYAVFCRLTRFENLTSVFMFTKNLFWVMIVASFFWLSDQTEQPRFVSWKAVLHHITWTALYRTIRLMGEGFFGWELVALIGIEMDRGLRWVHFLLLFTFWLKLINYKGDSVFQCF